MQKHCRLRLSIFTLVLLITINIVNESSTFVVLANSLSLDHQEIPFTSKWTKPKLSYGVHHDEIRDGRTIYFETDSDSAQCQIEHLPKLSSVTYVSDGRTWNTTFWLSQPPLNNTFSHYPFVNATQIRQQFLDIQIWPSNDKSLDELIQHKNYSLIKEGFTEVFSDLKSIKPINTTLDNHHAYKFVVDGKRKPEFGNLDVKAMEVISLIYNKLYKILYVADTTEYSNLLSTINKTISSFKVLNGTVNANSTSNSSIRKDFDQINHLNPYTNLELGIEIKNPPQNWGILDDSHSVKFFSPIKGPYLLSNEYGVAIDIPTGYNTGTDYMARIIWEDNSFNQSWTKVIEERSQLANKSRYLDIEPNYKESFKKGSPFVLLPIDLRILNSPQNYVTIFGQLITFIIDGQFCNLVDFSNTVSNPPPKYSIVPLQNSSTVDPGKAKTMEIKVKSFSNIPLHVYFNVSLSPNSSDFVKTSFSADDINIPPLGWGTTKLTIKSKLDTWENFLKPETNTESLRIVAKAAFPKEVKYNFLNTATHITGPEITGPEETLFLPITIFNGYDYILNILNSLSAPVNVYFGVITAIAGAIGGWILNRSKNKKDSEDT